jgi:hypothetical protein
VTLRLSRGCKQPLLYASSKSNSGKLGRRLRPWPMLWKHLVCIMRNGCTRFVVCVACADCILRQLQCGEVLAISGHVLKHFAVDAILLFLSAEPLVTCCSGPHFAVCLLPGTSGDGLWAHCNSCDRCTGHTRCAPVCKVTEHMILMQRSFGREENSSNLNMKKISEYREKSVPPGPGKWKPYCSNAVLLHMF